MFSILLFVICSVIFSFLDTLPITQLLSICPLPTTEAPSRLEIPPSSMSVITETFSFVHHHCHIYFANSHFTSHLKANPLVFSLQNSTLSISSVVFSQQPNHSLASVDAFSRFNLLDSEVLLPVSTVPLFTTSDGHICLNNIVFHSDTEYLYQPLIESHTHHSTVDAISISISSSTSLSQSPILISGQGQAVMLYSSHIYNLSTVVGLEPAITTIQRSLVVSNEISSSTSPLTHLLLSAARTISIDHTNNTFSHITNNLPSPSTPISASTTYTSDRFVYCTSSSSSEGGALTLLASARLTLSKCVFTDCKNTHSKGQGGVIRATSGTLDISSTRFEGCSAYTAGSIYISSTVINIISSTFYESVSTAASRTTEYDVSDPSKFVNEGGGAIFCILGKDFVLKDCLFMRCVANSTGGGIIFYPYGVNSPSFFEMHYIYFTGTNVLDDINGNGRSNCVGGHNIMITHQQFSDNVQTASYFQNGKNPTSTPHCLAIFTDSVLDGTAKAFHNGRSGTISMDSGELSSVMSVSVDGTDQLTCSTAPKCLTVAYAARKITNGGTIHVEQGTFGSNGQEDGILVETREIGLSGAGKDKTKVILTQKEGTDANFFISTGSLSLSSLALKLPSAPATTVLGLIAVDGQGELSIEFCELSGNADQQTTILVSAINGAVVRIVSSSFRDLEGLGSGGCCVDVVLGGVGSVNITSCDFSGVTTTQTTDYTASLIRIELTENTQSFCLASLVFDPSIPLFPASHIHILAPDVTQCITPSQFSLDFEDTAEDNQRFVATSEEPFRSKESFGIPWYFESLITLYMDSNGDDTNACDTAVTACRTLQRAAEIMGGLTNFTVRVKSGAVAGSVDVTDATIVSSSTSELAAVQATAESDAVPLLSVDGGRLVCTRLDISVQPTSQNDFVLLRGVNSADIQLTHCVLHCESLFVSEDAAVDICSWETGAVAVVDSSLDLSDTTLSSFSQGALFLEDSSLSLSNTQFEGNSPSNEKYTQARRNMVCSNSSIAMGEGVVFADNTKDTPLCMWITGNECKVSTNGSVSTNHLLFQLQIDSKLNVSLNDTNLIVNVTGKNIFPCNVVLTIVPNKTASNRDTIRIPLQEDGDVEGISDLTLTDTSISFQISSIYVPWREEQSYFQILVDGESIQTFEAFYKFVSMPTSSLLQWILLGVAVGVGLVLVCIATIFLVRHAAKRAARLQSRRRVMSEEMDAIGTNLTQHTLTKFSSLPPAPPAFCPVLVLPGQDEKEVLGEWDVPCVLCDDAEFRWCYGDSRRSVFSQLHSIEGGKDDILDSNGQKEQISGFSPVETVSILLKVVAALKFLLASPSKHDSSLFTPASLSSHSILVFPNGQVCLALPQPLAESVGLKNPNAIHRQNNVFFSDSISNRRWFSPELATPSTVLNAPEVAQSLVFSLGLVLFEMVVGEVPFGQLDGIQAQRKIQIGLLPDLKLITHGKKKTADKTFNAIRDKHELEQTVKDEDTEAAIERAVVLEEMCAKCLRFGGKDRPQLTQLKEQLELLV